MSDPTPADRATAEEELFITRDELQATVDEADRDGLAGSRVVRLFLSDLRDAVTLMRRVPEPDSDRGQIFREAWIEGVRRHYPGEPKASYVASWDEMPEWEQRAAEAVAAHLAGFLATSGAGASKLAREQKGRFVAICWLAQVYLRIPDPKPGYVADWADLPEWQRETDADIFEAFERSVQAPEPGLPPSPSRSSP